MAQHCKVTLQGHIQWRLSASDQRNRWLAELPSLRLKYQTGLQKSLRDQYMSDAL
jgi:hypothetical protein